MAPDQSDTGGNQDSSRISPPEHVSLPHRITEPRLTAVTSDPAERHLEKHLKAIESQSPVKDQERCVSVAYRSLNVYGFGATTDYQKTFSNYPLAHLSLLKGLFGRLQKSRIDILQGFEGVVSSGEMLLVLGRPGSGCTTFLKTLAGNTHGLYVDKSSRINYQGGSFMSPNS